MSSRLPTRLELHRLKLAKNNFVGELLSIDDLDEAENKIISEDFFKRIHVKNEDDDNYSIYGQVLSSWGVICPHPKERITVDEKRENGVHLYFNCRCCGALVVNRQEIRKECRIHPEGSNASNFRKA
jgi:hypothetical protein